MSRTRSNDIAAVVQEAIDAILREHGRDVGEITDRDRLSAELGLSSSQVAELVSRIGTRLQADALSRITAITDLVTVGDLVQAWRQAIAGDGGGPDELLQASRERAWARRQGRLGR